MGRKNKLNKWKKSLRKRLRRRKKNKENKKENQEIKKKKVYKVSKNKLCEGENSLLNSKQCNEICGKEIYVSMTQPKCDQDIPSEEIYALNCEAIESERDELKDELKDIEKNSILRDDLNKLLDENVCTPFKKLEADYNNLQKDFNSCNQANIEKKERIEELYRRYKTDIKKYHEKITELLTEEKSITVDDGKTQIYKEESLMLQNKIRNNWRRIYVVLVILIVVSISCILKFFDFI